MSELPLQDIDWKTLSTPNVNFEEFANSSTLGFVCFNIIAFLASGVPSQSATYQEAQDKINVQKVHVATPPPRSEN